MIKPFFEHTCDKCGTFYEAKFVAANIHIKQVCVYCDAYVKFFEKRNMPSIEDIKKKIWALTGGNIDVINDYKFHTDFPKQDIEYRKDMQLEYYKLYLKIRLEYYPL